MADYSKTPETLFLSFKTLESDYAIISSSIDAFKKQVGTVDLDDQSTDDLSNIDLGLTKFKKLLDAAQEQASRDGLLDPEDLKTLRHDLRGAIGTITGYGELINEVLEDIDAPNDVRASCAKMVATANGILPHVALVTIDDTDTKPESAQEPLVDSPYMAVTDAAKVLIVDDNEQKQDLFKRNVEKMGHATFTADSGPEALEFLKDNDVDLILLDLLMPEMNGDEVLEHLKEDERLRLIPVLVISSSSDMDNVIKCIRLGAVDYLPTPVNNTLLHARVNSCLVKKQARDRETKALEQMTEAQYRLKTAIENIDEGFAVYDSEDKLIMHNTCFEKLYPSVLTLENQDATYEDFLRQSVADNIFQVNRRDPLDESNLLDEDIEKWVECRLSYHRNPARPYIELLTSGKWVEVIKNRIPGGGCVSVHKDISANKEKEQRLEFLALHDPLTGIANRKSFDATLEETFKASSENNTSFGLIFFDLDGFKAVNDTFGHDFGDHLLKEVSTKLTACVRESDLIARLGGDEFAAIIKDVDSQEQIESVAKRCLDSIGSSTEKDGRTAKFGVSIGISIFPTHGNAINVLLKKADEAMYEAKKSGKGQYRIAAA